jgi:TrkA domain protein
VRLEVPIDFSPNGYGGTPAMDITRTTVPGVGIMHHCVSRDGAHFGVLTQRSGDRRLLVYGPTTADSTVLDEPLASIRLEVDEADQVADLLHSRPIPDRMAELERRVTQMAEIVR